MKNIVIATLKSWNIDNIINIENKFSDIYKIYTITERSKLIAENLKKINPDYIFFPHWSWKIPQEVYSLYNCIIFHTSDLPNGRGGSPIQNQIIRGIGNTKICAIKCIDVIDGGDVYCKENIDIGKGNIDEILMEISDIIFKKMIPFILEYNPIPQKQIGEIFNFKRRSIGESNISKSEIRTLNQFYDFIRMLDGEGYPKANIDIGNLKINFSNIIKRNGYLEGVFKVYEK